MTMEPTRRIEYRGKMLTYKEAAVVMDLSYAHMVRMYGMGYKTITQMRAYRLEIENDHPKRMGGKARNVYQTSKGDLTLIDMVDMHPHGLTLPAIRTRGDKWGFDHEAIWMPAMQGWTKFNELAIALDGPPRPAARVVASNPADYQPAAGVKTSGGKAPINRLKCCLRDKGREKCKTYQERLNMEQGVPEPCKVAAGDFCSNYDGVEINVISIHSDRPPIHYTCGGSVYS